MKRILCLLLGVVLISCFASPSLAGKGHQKGCTFDFDIDVRVSSQLIPPGDGVDIYVCPGDEVTISATIENTGTCTDRYEIVGRMIFDMEEILVGEAALRIKAGESKTCSFTQVIPSVPEGIYAVEVEVTNVPGGNTKIRTANLIVEECEGEEFIVEVNPQIIRLSRITGRGQMVTVTVENSSSKNPVEDAQVTIFGCGVDETCVTNGRGAAVFRGVVPTDTGTIQVVVSKDGYIDGSASIAVVN